MSTGALVSMICIVSIVLGGFIYFLFKAIKKEQQNDG